MLSSLLRPVRPAIYLRFLSTQSFGDLTDQSSKYHPVLLTSVLAAYHAYNENPIKSLQKFNSSIGESKKEKKLNHLIDNIVYSSIHHDNIRDVFHGGEKMQVKYMICDNKKEKILFVAIRGSQTKLDWIQDAHLRLTEPFLDLPGKSSFLFQIFLK